MSEIIKAPPQALATTITTDDARARVTIARVRLAVKLEEVRQTLEPYSQWRSVVKKHPLITIGGAFFVGYALSRLFSRK